jgi:hypothetical protein
VASERHESRGERADMVAFASTTRFSEPIPGPGDGLLVLVLQRPEERRVVGVQDPRQCASRLPAEGRLATGLGIRWDVFRTAQVFGPLDNEVDRTDRDRGIRRQRECRFISRAGRRGSDERKCRLNPEEEPLPGPPPEAFHPPRVVFVRCNALHIQSSPPEQRECTWQVPGAGDHHRPCDSALRQRRCAEASIVVGGQRRALANNRVLRHPPHRKLARHDVRLNETAPRAPSASDDDRLHFPVPREYACGRLDSQRERFSSQTPAIVQPDSAPEDDDCVEHRPAPGL